MGTGLMRALWRPRLQLYSHQEGECRIWDGAANKDGYGVFTYVEPGTGKRRSMGAHKAAFLAAGNGVLPGQVVRHVKCHRTLCIEPKHLAAGTQKENLEDRKQTGTWERRGGKTRVKLGEREERLAAMRAGISAKEFSVRFGVKENAAFQWLRRWKRRAGNPVDNKTPPATFMSGASEVSEYTIMRHSDSDRERKS